VKKYLIYGLVGVLPAFVAFADCDIERYHGDCTTPVQHEPAFGARALAYCGTTNVYLSAEDYLKLMHYRRAGINLILKVNGEFVDGPCQLADYEP